MISDNPFSDAIYTYYNPRTHEIEALPNWKAPVQEKPESDDEKDISIVKTISQPKSKRARTKDALSQMMEDVRSQTRKRLKLK